MVEGWPRRALSPGPQSSSLLDSSWKSLDLPEFRTRGPISGAAAIAWPQAWCHLGAAEHALSRTKPESMHPPGAVF